MNLIEVTEKFPDELAATLFFEKARWGENPKCAYCGSDKISKRKSDYRFTCMNCTKSFSVTVGTMLHKTRVPLRTWHAKSPRGWYCRTRRKRHCQSDANAFS